MTNLYLKLITTQARQYKHREKPNRNNRKQLIQIINISTAAFDIIQTE